MGPSIFIKESVKEKMIQATKMKVEEEKMTPNFWKNESEGTTKSAFIINTIREWIKIDSDMGFLVIDSKVMKINNNNNNS